MSEAGRDIYTADELQAIEARFFDEVASRRRPDTRRTITADTRFPYVTPAGDRAIRAHLGDLTDRRVLDVGCGSGVSTVILARLGAKVCAFDISEKYLEMARERIQANGVEDRVQWIGRMGAERIEFGDGAFDAAFGGHVLHHTKLTHSVPEVSRVLKSGSPAAFLETLGTNPLFRFARRHLVGRFGIPKFMNETEYPLRGPELEFIARHFAEFSLRGDLGLSMLNGYVVRRARIERTLNAIDGAFFRILPFMSKLAYGGIVLLRK